MFQIFVFLSYYETIEYISTKNSLTTFPMLEYGFKKNAILSFSISDVRIPGMSFGFGTRAEIKNLTSRRSIICDRNYSKIQYFFNLRIERNITIPSTGVLTPFALNCIKSNHFKLYLDFKNGKTHLDYRCQNAMIYSLVFSIIYFITGLSFLICCIIFKRKQPSMYIILTIFILFSGLEEILIYPYFKKNEDKEFPEELIYDIYHIFISIFHFISLISLSVYNVLLHFYTSFLSRKLEVCTKHYFIGISSTIFLIISFISQFFKANYFNHIVSAVFYLIFAIIEVLIPAPISISKGAIILYIFGSFFTFALRNSLLIEANKSMSTYSMLIGLNLANIILQIISIILLLLGFSYFNDTAFKNFVLSTNKTLNYSEEEQRSGPSNLNNNLIF